MERALEMIRKAQKPFIFVGGGAVISNASEELFVRNRRGPFDDNGHGTHVSGIIASGGRFGDGSGIGVAPESSIVMLKVLERDGSGKIKNMIKGMEWICMNHKKYGIPFSCGCRLQPVSSSTAARQTAPNFFKIFL